jgi:hypothetical protein
MTTTHPDTSLITRHSFAPWWCRGICVDTFARPEDNHPLSRRRPDFGKGRLK